MSDVRATPGTPVLADCHDSKNTPIVIDSSTGAAYCVKSGDALVEIGRDAGWNDFLGSFTDGKIAGVNVPTWAVFRNGIYGYGFAAAAMNEIWMNCHILHDYLPGTMIYPHIHWSTAGVNAGVVRWGVEYTYARGYGIEPFPATTTVYLEQAAAGVAYTHMIAEAAEGAGVTIPTLEADGILLMRIFRDAAHANDTCTDVAFGLFCDIHYQSDGMLTNERNRTFTKKRGMF